MHISFGNWIYRHRSYTGLNLCTYPLGIEHVGTKPYTSQKGRTQNLCTYPPGIEYASTDPIQVKIHAHILRELNMQTHHTNFTHISYGNWTCKRGRRGRDRDQDHPKARVSSKQVDIEMEKTKGASHTKKFEARAPDWHHKYISFLAHKSTFVCFSF